MFGSLRLSPYTFELGVLVVGQKQNSVKFAPLDIIFDLSMLAISRLNIIFL
jgi:hypothetical protein